MHLALMCRARNFVTCHVLDCSEGRLQSSIVVDVEIVGKGVNDPAL